MTERSSVAALAAGRTHSADIWSPITIASSCRGGAVLPVPPLLSSTWVSSRAWQENGRNRRDRDRRGPRWGVRSGLRGRPHPLRDDKSGGSRAARKKRSPSYVLHPAVSARGRARAWIAAM